MEKIQSITEFPFDKPHELRNASNSSDLTCNTTFKTYTSGVKRIKNDTISPNSLIISQTLPLR